jgi:hypothetical protein
MITCDLRGGLGNQLFQIFTTIAYALENKETFGFLKQDFLGGNSSLKRVTYWNTFLKSLRFFLFQNPPENVYGIKEQGFHYNPLPRCHADNVLLIGYFQSYKYFDKYKETIFKLIRLEKFKNDTKFQGNEECISMHFRLGDYKHLGHFHPIMDIDYYKNALSYILQKDTTAKKVLYFCEEEDNVDVIEKIDRLKSIFPECLFEKADDALIDYDQMILMSCCKHNIIANSSFSWFGSYFNENNEKIVCYPKTWFCGLGSELNTNDICPENWISF